jgi:hypothetical protein
MFSKILSDLDSQVALRLTAWYSFAFVLSTLFLFGFAYFLASSLNKGPAGGEDKTEGSLSIPTGGIASVQGPPKELHKGILFSFAPEPREQDTHSSIPRTWED